MKNLIIVPTLAVSMIGLSYMATADGIQRARVNTVSQTSATENVNGSDRVFDNGSVTSKANPGTASRKVTATGGRGGADRIVASECSDSSIDVNQPSNTTCMAYFGQVDLAQSFIPNAGSYSGAGIAFTADASGDNVTIALYDALPNVGGTMLASGTSTTDGTNWVDVSWDAVSVNPGSTYYLVFTCDTTGPCIAGDTNNPYPDGMTFANSGFGEFPDYDYTFRTYQCNDTGGGDCEQSVIDVDQPSNTTCMANFYQDDLAQSFIPGADNSTGAGIEFTSTSSGNTVSIGLWDALPNAGGTELASGTSTSSGDSWLDVSWNEVSVTPGDTYYLVFTLDSGDQGLCIGGDLSNPYPDGMTFANSGYGEFPNFDYTFRTYSCDDAGGGPCPEDVNGDGNVDVLDLLAVVGAWGPCP